MIAEVLFPEGVPDDLRQYGLVMPKTVRDSLVDKQDALNLQHRVNPVALADGRYALNADVLTEAKTDGLFNHIDQIDPDNLAQVVTMPLAAVFALLPEPDPEMFP